MSDEQPRVSPVESTAPPAGPRSLFSALLESAQGQPAAQGRDAHIGGIVIGELLALADEGRTPVVRFVASGSVNAGFARSSVELRGAHIGRSVVLMFEEGDPARPIVMGLVRTTDSPPDLSPRHVDVDADGERLTVGARHQLVLRCGKACITLTREGKVLIEGSYVLSRSTGLNRIKGGSVQIN